MFVGQVEIAIVKGSKGVKVVVVHHHVWRHTDAVQGFLWYVAATKSQVLGYVSENVDHLQGFAESDATFHEQRLLIWWQFHQMSKRHLRPKHANATGDSKRVIVKFLIVLECRYSSALVGRSKPFKIHYLATHNDVQAFQHSALVFGAVHR